MSGVRTRVPAAAAVDLSLRCTARVCFPTEPYHNLRCKLRPHNPTDLHIAETEVPTEYVAPGQAAWRKPDVVTVQLTWSDPSITPTN